MLRFSEYFEYKSNQHFYDNFELNEGKYPLWVRFTVGGIVLKIKSLETQISNEKNLQKKIDLQSKQNTLLSYISGLGVGVSSTDPILLKRLKSVSSGKK